MVLRLPKDLFVSGHDQKYETPEPGHQKIVKKIVLLITFWIDCYKLKFSPTLAFTAFNLFAISILK